MARIRPHNNPTNTHLKIIFPPSPRSRQVVSYHQVFIIKIFIYFLKFQILFLSHSISTIQLRCVLFSILLSFLSINSKCETSYLFQTKYRIMKNTVFLDVMACRLFVEVSHTFQRKVLPPYSRRHLIEDDSTDSQRRTNIGYRSFTLCSTEMINSSL